MGLGSLIGEGFKDVGKLGLNAGLSSLEITGRAAMGGTGSIGRSLGRQFEKNSINVVGAALTGAAMGGILADQDGQADVGKTALQGGAWGLAAAAIPGGIGAAAVTGLGVAAGGAAMMGVGAFGAIGRSMVRPITHAEKASAIEKEMMKTAKKSGKEFATKEFEERLAKEGVIAGEKSAVKIGLGNLNDFKLGKLAVPLILGASLVKGLSGGVDAFEKSRMGVNDGQYRSATPMLPTAQQSAPSYANNAGATGDLVFAMHKNRR